MLFLDVQHGLSKLVQAHASFFSSRPLWSPHRVTFYRRDPKLRDQKITLKNKVHHFVLV